MIARTTCAMTWQARKIRAFLMRDKVQHTATFMIVLYTQPSAARVVHPQQ